MESFTWTINLVTLVAGIVTIVWFIRDMRRENSKILKSILETQVKGFETLSADLKYIAELLSKK